MSWGTCAQGGWTGHALPPCFSSHTVNSALLTVYLVPDFFTVLCFFLLVILLFKMAPSSVVQKCCLVFLRTRAVMCLKRKVRVRRASFSMSPVLALSSVLMKQAHIVNKVSNRNSFIDTREVLYWLADETWPEAQEPNPLFRLGATVQYPLIQCLWQLYRTQLPGIMKISCFIVAEDSVYSAYWFSYILMLVIYSSLCFTEIENHGMLCLVLA